MIHKKKVISELEKKLGLSFNNKELILTGLTHSSYANLKKEVKYNERMEYLGDAVLELIISEYLFMRCEDKSEGDLTKTRALIVCENSLFEIANGWDLGKYILMSKGEESTGGRKRSSILSNCVEAIIAAVYLDKGIEFTKEFVLKNFDDIINKAIENKIVLDYKTKLQEILQQNGVIDISYELAKLEGPPHRPKFFIDLKVENVTKSNGEGYTKKEAEQNAAKAYVQLMEELNE